MCSLCGSCERSGPTASRPTAPAQPGHRHRPDRGRRSSADPGGTHAPQPRPRPPRGGSRDEDPQSSGRRGRRRVDGLLTDGGAGQRSSSGRRRAGRPGRAAPPPPPPTCRSRCAPPTPTAAAPGALRGTQRGATVPAAAAGPLHHRRAAGHAELHLQQPPGHDHPAGQWAVNTRSQLNTAMVVQLGDLVSEDENLTQWGHTSTGLKVLDDAGMPEHRVAGNHDFDNVTGALRRVRPVLPAVALHQRALDARRPRATAATWARTSSDPTRSTART